MWLIERKFHAIFSCLLIHIVFPYVLEALVKITGLYPAMMRPRTSLLILFEQTTLLIKVFCSVWKL